MTNIPRSVTKRLLSKMVRSPDTARLCSLGMQAFGYRPYAIGSLERHAEMTLDPVFDASESHVARPRPTGAEPELLVRNLPPVSPLVLGGVFGKSGSSILRTTSHALFPEHALAEFSRLDFRNARETFILQNGLIALKQDHVEGLPKGICAFGHGDSNWYHWLAEVLPTVFLSRNLPAIYDDYPLLVPRKVLRIPSFRDSLEICRGDRAVTEFPGKHLFRIGKLVYIPPVVSGPFNMKPHHWPAPPDYIHNIGVMRQFRSVFLDALGITDDRSTPARVFLARPPGSRSYNQDEIFEVAKRRGFEPIRMETLSFRDQVNLMFNAEYVVGPTGAAFANTLFMRPGSRSLVWALKEYSGACFFSSLAHVAGSDMSYCFVDSDNPVNSSDEAFRATYRLPVDQFTDHLDALLEDDSAAAS